VGAYFLANSLCSNARKYTSLWVLILWSTLISTWPVIIVHVSTDHIFHLTSHISVLDYSICNCSKPVRTNLKILQQYYNQKLRIMKHSSLCIHVSYVFCRFAHRYNLLDKVVKCLKHDIKYLYPQTCMVHSNFSSCLL